MNVTNTYFEYLDQTLGVLILTGAQWKLRV